MSYTGEEGWTCGLGRCCRTSVSLHWTFWFNVAFQLVFAIILYPKSWKFMVMIVTVWGPCAVLTLIFHEMGHIWRTRSFGGSATRTMLWPLGGFNDANIPNGTCMQEFWVAFCGPLMHIPQIFFWLGIMAVSAPNGLDWYGSNFDINRFEVGPGEFFAEVSKRTLGINIMLFVINLILPAYPMDAANMVAAMAVNCGATVETAGIVLVVIGGVLGVIALVYGIIALIAGGGQGLFLLLVGLFVLYTSWSLWKMVSGGTIHLHPIFRADCYKGRSTAAGNNGDVEMGNRRSAPPAQLPKRSEAPPPKKIKKNKNTSGPKKPPPKTVETKKSAGNKKPQQGRKPRKPRT